MSHGAPVRKQCFVHFLCSNQPFYQDRLQTNIGKSNITETLSVSSQLSTTNQQSDSTAPSAILLVRNSTAGGR